MWWVMPHRLFTLLLNPPHFVEDILHILHIFASVQGQMLRQQIPNQDNYTYWLNYPWNFCIGNMAV